MIDQTEEQDSRCQVETVSMPTSITISDVNEIVELLRKIPVITENRIFLDFTNVETITTPGIQLMISLKKTLETAGGQLLIINQNDDVTSAFDDMGLGFLVGHSQESGYGVF